nr:amino acid adenylation domain-containing protein [Parasporobacterium sp.]
MEKEKDINIKTTLIKEILSSFINTKELADEDKNLLELGLSSIQIMNINSKFRKKGYKSTFSKLISRPTISSWKSILTFDDNEKQNEKSGEKKVENMYEPFPLTEVQYAYWVGRKEGNSIGKVGCHGYLEIDGKCVDPMRLEYAWNVLQMHHPMLRVAYTDDGKQYIKKEPYKYGIDIYDYTDKDPKEHLENMRNKLSHRLLDIDNGQVAELSITLLKNGCTRIHFDIDLLICDVKSFQIILRDLAHTYASGELPRAMADFNFADYIKKDQIRSDKLLDDAKKYWIERLKTMPGAPELPVKQKNIENPRFCRRKAVLETSRWEKFKEKASGCGITPAMALLTLYGEVMARFSQNKNFLMNIPLFNRNEEDEKIEDVVADFTTILLLEMNLEARESFVSKAKKVQERFHNDMEYIAYSGLKLEREYKKMHPGTGIVAPIVFSCNLGIPLFNKEFEDNLGQMAYMISQTPQVWLDFQLFDVNEGMMMIWDSVDEVFEENIPDEMFSLFTDTLSRLCDDDSLWEKDEITTVDKALEVRAGFETKTNDVPMGPIYGKFTDFAKNDGNKVAIVDQQLGSISYKKLYDEARAISSYLMEYGVQKGDSVGVACKRGYKQISAILGVLFAGGRYVIVGNTQPLKRKKVICKKAEINIVLTDESKKWEETNICHVADVSVASNANITKEIVNIEGFESAYIIFTSGTTGEPKGVEITHHAAYNTIYSLNKMYSIGKNDAVLAVSNTDFDLSVYDIFGMLSVGGKIVLLTEESRKDAKCWCKLINENNVTVWNTVPVLLDMLTLEAKADGYSFDSLRYAFQSGDWIGLDLPARLNNIAKNARFISMGGATECSIWSNYQEVTLPLDPAWKSIPYGHPLPNQKYRVVDTKGLDCPDYVEGELLIGGVGVAKGYINEEKLTNEKFITYQNEKWYKTGDYGKFWNDGTIEFLGRKDFQVKVRGHRIELEEIE